MVQFMLDLCYGAPRGMRRSKVRLSHSRPGISLLTGSCERFCHKPVLQESPSQALLSVFCPLSLLYSPRGPGGTG